MRTFAPILLLAVASTSCLGPQVSDNIVRNDVLLPEGSEVPSVYDGDDLDGIVENEGVNGTVPLTTAFAEGTLVRFWNFGDVPDHVSPVFRLVQGGQPIDHPPIFVMVPGDPGYSPFLSIFNVEVNASYMGQLITSQSALNYAQSIGLVGAGTPMGQIVNWPVVDPTIRVDIGGGQTAAASHVFYYDGQQGVYFDFGTARTESDNVTVLPTSLYELRREGGDPISEPERHVDLDGDGDTNDTNDVFAVPAGASFSPRCQIVVVTVPASTGSIDTTHSQSMVDINAAGDLFSSTGVPIAGTVLGVDQTDRFLNCIPLVSVEGI